MPGIERGADLGWHLGRDLLSVTRVVQRLDPDRIRTERDAEIDAEAASREALVTLVVEGGKEGLAAAIKEILNRQKMGRGFLREVERGMSEN